MGPGPEPLVRVPLLLHIGWSFRAEPRSGASMTSKRACAARTMLATTSRADVWTESEGSGLVPRTGLYIARKCPSCEKDDSELLAVTPIKRGLMSRVASSTTAEAGSLPSRRPQKACGLRNLLAAEYAVPGMQKGDVRCCSVITGEQSQRDICVPEMSFGWSDAAGPSLSWCTALQGTTSKEPRRTAMIWDVIAG